MDRRRLSRRRLLRLSAFLAGGAALAACAQPAATPVAPKPTEPPAEAATAVSGPTPAPPEAPKEPVVLRYIQHWHVPEDTHYTAMEWVYKTFQERNPDIRIDSIDMSADESIPKIRADCAAGDCPEIVHQTTVEWWQSGWLLDLTPYVDQAWKGRFAPGALDLLTWEGHIFSLPLEFSPLVTIWNRELVSDLGLEIPTTWDGFIALGQAARAKGLNTCSFGCFQGGVHFGNGLIWGRPGGAEAMAQGQWDNDAVRYALTRVKEDVVGKKLIADDDLSIDYSQGLSLWQQNKLIAYHDGAWTINNWITPGGEDKFGMAAKTVFAPFFSTEGGLGTTVRIFSNGVGLSAKLKDDPAKLDAAVKLMDFWTSEESAIQFVLGGSPMGVTVSNMPTDKVPLLAAFLKASSTGDVTYTGSEPAVLRAHMWDHFLQAAQAVGMGKSVDEAVQIYVDTMTGYEQGA